MSARLTAAEKAELRELEAAFRYAGGRGVDLAERIDYLRAKRDGRLCEACGNSLDTWDHDECGEGDDS